MTLRPSHDVVASYAHAGFTKFLNEMAGQPDSLQADRVESCCMAYMGTLTNLFTLDKLGVTGIDTGPLGQCYVCAQQEDDDGKP
jgi:hypothetical protein